MVSPCGLHELEISDVRDECEDSIVYNKSNGYAYKRGDLM